MSGTIVTLTPNPSIDRTVTLTGELQRGAVLRAATISSQGGGKGVNISRAAVAANVPTIAVLPAHKDDPFVLDLLRDGIDCRPETPAGDVRVNLTLTEPDGTTTKVNTPGAVRAAGRPRPARRRGHPPRPAGPLGRARRLAAARRAGRLVRRAGRAPSPAPAPASRWTPRGTRSSRWPQVSPTAPRS